MPNQPAGAFLAVLNWLLIIAQSLVLLLSEASLPLTDRFFSSFFPNLSPSFGLGALGVVQCLLGAAVLSHRVNTLTLVAAFLLFSVGCLHVLLGLVWREKAKVYRSLAGWRAAKRDILPRVEDGVVQVPAFAAPPPGLFMGGYGYSDEKGSGAPNAARSGSLSSQKSGLGFGRQAAKFAANQGFVVREPEEAVPPYAPKPTVHFTGGPRSHVSVSSASSYSESRSGHDREEERERAYAHEHGRRYAHEGFSPVEEVSEPGDDEEDEVRANSMVRTDSSATAVEHRR